MRPTTLPHGSATSTTQPVRSCLTGSTGRTPRSLNPSAAARASGTSNHTRGERRGGEGARVGSVAQEQPRVLVAEAVADDARLGGKANFSVSPKARP